MIQRPLGNAVRMGFLGKMMKAGVAKRVISEARKPENQRKAKELFNKLRDKRAKTRR